MNKILSYIEDLSQTELAHEKAYFKEYSRCKKIYAGVQATSGLAVATGSAGVATGVTVVGLPVTVILASIGIVTGITGCVLNAVAKSHQKTYVKHARKLQIAQKGRIDLEKIIAYGSNVDTKGELVKSLSQKEIELAYDIYEDALKKLNVQRISAFTDLTFGPSLQDYAVPVPNDGAGANAGT